MCIVRRNETATMQYRTSAEKKKKKKKGSQNQELSEPEMRRSQK